MGQMQRFKRSLITFDRLAGHKCFYKKFAKLTEMKQTCPVLIELHNLNNTLETNSARTPTTCLEKYICFQTTYEKNIKQAN